MIGRKKQSDTYIMETRKGRSNLLSNKLLCYFTSTANDRISYI